MSENKTGKYLKYAIGEILLVVIGILIALAINNKNEARKDEITSKQYLEGIKKDLQNDLVQTERALKQISYDLSVVTSIDSTLYDLHANRSEGINQLFTNPNQMTPDTIYIESLFYRNRSFRSVNGTYKSLIADGKSGLVKNKDLSQKVQAIYDGEYQRLASTYESIKAIEQKINWAYPIEIRKWSYSDLMEAKDEKIFYDVMRLVEEKGFYAGNLVRTKNAINEVVVLINDELEK
ncbi:DUF6090 family protein [uncultured Eudoraea sp.]|uniref:DUF6090 family protein n=1 Tax=uncultured Eudoraea sp. TaxID=1035614 RepID=UPI002639E595|nr:DUF6090 family protein [uncultured Eudoraea sp.]